MLQNFENILVLFRTRQMDQIRSFVDQHSFDKLDVLGIQESTMLVQYTVDGNGGWMLLVHFLPLLPSNNRNIFNF